jgi:hypothetical protein
MKNKYEKGIILSHFSFSFLRIFLFLDFQRIEKYVATFPYWFCFGNKCLDRFLKLVIVNLRWLLGSS